MAASQAFPYVLLSHPQTGLENWAQSVGGAVHVPVGLGWAQLPTAKSQNFPSSQATLAVPPQGQAPSEATETPAAEASQRLAYVLPSQPHTGALAAPVHELGTATQLPVASASPQAPSAYWQ